MKVLIDTDCGMGIYGADVDDGIALLMALGSSNISIEGVTVCGGNVLVDEAFRCVCALFHALKVTDIPVVKGLDGTLTGTPVFTSREWVQNSFRTSGRSYLPGENWLPKDVDENVSPVDVGDFLNEVVTRFPNEVSLVALGPLTNVAYTMRNYPDFSRSVKQIITMGGYITKPRPGTTEYNFEADLVAAHEVLRSGVPITVVPLDITTKTWMNQVTWQQVLSESVIPSYVVSAVGSWFEILNRGFDMKGFFLHDPLALAIALDANLVTSKSYAAVDHSAVPNIVLTDDETSVQVVTDVHLSEFLSRVIELLSGC